ncbi:hypothetical protein UFOVP438_13 [uncultured Caudovirales phage]|uniref:Uncharacterized protein n=1 Tax=uncultured Caudovirales phage TaxID=2100421 RepID=A0A6J5MBQ0_9CAUD|nr:hypothetical protein UFOVP438_13 [uncultured Caudovirales phage]
MAAGQGFKTFTTGEVLTAGDVNGYLMQGINVFTNATARDAAITAPAEGQFAFTKDNNSLWYYDGAAWVASGATGDIEGVTAGVGISGGGTSGTVTVTNSMATAIDAKGDLVPGTGADTFARLAVGANNTFLQAASGESTGMKWGGAYTAWTPTLGGMTLGNGTMAGSYIQIGKFVHATLYIVFGSTTSVTGNMNFTYPTGASSCATVTNTYIGTVRMLDAGVQNYSGMVIVNNNNTFSFFAQNSAGTYTIPDIARVGVPFTWNTNDEFQLSMTYEAV